MPKNNRSGKVIVVFAVIIAVLLISLTAISIFFFQKEHERRKATEAMLGESKASEARLDSELEEAKKTAFLMEEKNKEADERINSLLDEIELAEGLREELKNENNALKEKFEKEKSLRDELKGKMMVELDATKKTVNELQSQLTKINTENEALKTENTELKKKYEAIEMDFQKLSKAKKKKKKDNNEKTVKSTEVDVSFDDEKKEDEAYVVPDKIPDGRILSVDYDTEFVIVNLGKKDGVSVGKVLSIYRGQEYLGDVQVTRVQLEMSAADLIPPLSSKTARKNDKVVAR